MFRRPDTGRVDRFSDPVTFVQTLGDWMTGRGAMYRRLAAAIESAILAGELVPGARLPAERALARTLAVSRATVVAAIDELRARGLVESRQGSGTRVSSTRAGRRTSADSRADRGLAQPMLRRLAAPAGEVLSMAHAAEPGSAELVTTVREVVEADLPVLLGDFGYHPRGLWALRTALAAHYTGVGLPTDPDQILVTTGAQQALVLVTRLFVHDGSTVVLERPSWPGCFDVYDAAGARLVGVPLDDEGIRADALATALREHRPALLFVIPTFHNPTGTLMSRSRRRLVAELAARHDVPVLEDNADAAIGDAELPPPVAAFAPDTAEVVTVGTLSKAVWGGLRIGWVRAARPVVDRLAKHKALADLGSPLLDQAVAARLVPRLPELIAQRATLAHERLTYLTQALSEALPQWRWRRPTGGSALWIELPDMDATVFAQLALRHGVEVIPGRATDPTGEHDNFLRLPFTYPPQTATEVVTRLHQAWQALPSNPQ